MEAPPVHYVRTSDGFDIAYTIWGEGLPLVLMPTQFSHQELFWKRQSFFREWLRDLASQFRLIQYDGRGQGMSQRNLSPDLSVDYLVEDLKAVVDHLELNDFNLMASQWSVHAAVLFALEHPTRVSALILSCSNLNGSNFGLVPMRSFAQQRWEAFLLSQLQVGRPVDPVDSLAALKQTIDCSDWDCFMGAIQKSDLTQVIGGLQMPALIIHPRDPRLRVEESTRMAAAIPHASLIHIDGTPPFGDAEPGIQAIVRFLTNLPTSSEPASLGPGLSLREFEVLRLLAAGRSNPQIADALAISSNTVAKHVTSILTKTGTTNRVEAATYASRHGLA